MSGTCPSRTSESHGEHLAPFAHLFEEIRDVFSCLIVYSSGSDEKSKKSLKACHRLLTWLLTQVGLHIGKREIEYSPWRIRLQKYRVREVFYCLGMDFDHVRTQPSFA